MKTIMKVSASCVAALALVVVLNGCAEDNDKLSITDSTSGKPAKIVTPPGTPRTSADAYKASQQNNPMKNVKGYRQ